MAGRRAGAGEVDPLELPANQVDLWVADHRVQRDELKSCSVLLDAGERDRASRFRFEKDFRRFVFGHGRLRSILALYSGEPAETLRIGRICALCGSEEHGKPFLLLPSGVRSPIRFSYSYSDQLVVVAVANGAEVGVDVERIVAGFAWAEIAETALSSRERSLLEAVDAGSAAEAFYGIWTRKEAVAKASGRGLTQLTEMDTCDWTHGPGGGFAVSGGSPDRSWVGKVLELPGHAAAVAVEGSSPYEWSVREAPGDLQSLDKGA